MPGSRPAIHVVEKNPYTPQPFVMTELAICLRDAIRAAGYPSEHLVNRIDPEAFSIVLGGSPALQKELEHLDPRRCAIFNFEQLGSTSNIAGPEYRRWLADWLVLDYHSSNIDWLQRENGLRQRAFELPLVPSESLVTTGPEAKSVDVLFYGSMTERRKQVLRELEALGLKVEVVAGAYGRELAPAVRRARLVLHIHYYESALFPVARVLQPVMMGVPVVCENSVFSAMNDWSNSGIVFASYRQLAQACKDVLQMPDLMARRAAMTRDFVRRIDFATPFEQVVRAFEAAPAEGPLGDAEIEAILAAEGASPPEAGHQPPRLDLARREPGQGHYGKWMVWVLVAFIILGVIGTWR